MTEVKCVAGCRHYDGGEVKHHINCPYYPESLTKLYEDELCSLKQEIEQLRQWKAETISVMPDMQAIGKALNIRLGESIHDKILPGILGMQREVERRGKLIEKMYNNYNDTCPANIKWHQFKTENIL